MTHKSRRIKTKRGQARDDARSFEAFMAAHNEERARRDAEEARAGQEENEAFAERHLRGMREALWLEGGNDGQQQGKDDY